MPYPKKLLNDYETVALDLHPHWWSFANPVIAVIVASILGILSLTMIDDDSDAAKPVRWLALILVVVAALWLLLRYVKWATTNFVITSDRIIYRHGVIAKSGIEIPLERVNNVLFNQSIFERVLGSGDLLIESGGESGQQRFTDIKRPQRVQNLIHSQMESNEKRHFNPGSGGGDVASQLEKLEGMLERGTVTAAEFEAQKRKLLDG